MGEARGAAKALADRQAAATWRVVEHKPRADARKALDGLPQATRRACAAGVRGSLPHGSAAMDGSMTSSLLAVSLATALSLVPGASSQAAGDSSASPAGPA